MPPEDYTEPSAIYQHCCRVYATMMGRATRVQADGGSTEMVVYEGALTQLFVDLELSVPYYTSVMSKLKAMACVRQLRRGGGTSPSQWELLQEPTADRWFQMLASSAPKTPDKPDLNAQVMQVLSDMGKRVDRLEEALKLKGVPLPR